MNPSLLKSFLSGLAIFTLMQTSSPGTGFPDLAPSNPAGFGSGPSSTVITQLDLYPNIETIGVVARGSSSQTAELLVRQSGDTIWHPAHPLMRIDDGRLVGSLFGLAPATSYEVKVLDGPAEISSSITTQPDELHFTPSTVVHVSASAPAGGNGSVSAPFQTIQDGVNHAGPGTQVLVADGVYHEAVTFPASGTAGNWIQVRAEGNGAILDGSQNRTGSIWTATTVNHVYFTRISAPIAYLARDQARFYAYDNRTGLNQGLGHNGVSMNEGWFFEASTLKLFVRSLDDPSGHTWQIPILNHAFDANGRDWLWIEGFEMRFYGTSTSGCGVCTTNASHLVVRKNKIHNLQLGIFFNWNGTENQGNETRIEFNEIYDPPVNEWPWAAVKGSSMEGTAIVVRGHIGAIVRGNELHNFFNGIYTGSSGALENSALAFDADIYNNHIHHISDDALEPEGACINHRFRNNIVDTVFVGMSLAPITQGPTWVLHSLFTNYSGRGFKWDGNSDGIVLIYHNTSWSNAAGINAMDMISPIHNAVLRNNIFQSNGLGVNEVATGSTGHDWNDDNWYITRAVPHFKWENVPYNTLAGFCAATGLECNGYENASGLTNPSGGDFTLLSSSPNIDRGEVIPGINDGFAGSAPDVGAFEYVQGPSISGNAGVGGVSLTYTAGVVRIATSEANGDYTFSVPLGWSGTVTPSKEGYCFLPISRSYSDVTANRVGEDFTASACNTNVYIGGTPVESYFMQSGNSGQHNYAALQNGPVRITSSVPIIPSEQGFFGPYQTFNEVMGAPNSQLTTHYWFPWYDDKDMLTWVLVGNPSPSASAHVTVKIAGQAVGTYTIPPFGNVTPMYPNLQSGPVEVLSDLNVFASERTLLGYPDGAQSFNEVLGYPHNQLTSHYWFPWYDDKDMLTWVLVGNPNSNNVAHVTIKIAGAVAGSYTIAPYGNVTPIYPNVQSGPVEVISDVNVFTSERSLFGTSPSNYTFNEVMGFPHNQLTNSYWFPWYDNTNMIMWVLVGNPSATQTASVTVKIGGNVVGTYSILPYGNVTPTFPVTPGGPVQVISNIPVFTSERVLNGWPGTGASFNEMMGIANNKLTTDYWFTWYDNKDMTTELVIGRP
jgi:hypothetical protein